MPIRYVNPAPSRQRPAPRRAASRGTYGRRANASASWDDDRTYVQPMTGMRSARASATLRRVGRAAASAGRFAYIAAKAGVHGARRVGAYVEAHRPAPVAKPPARKRRKKKISATPARSRSRRRAAKRAARKNPTTRKKTMAKKKLFGAAAKAHARKLARGKRRRKGAARPKRKSAKRSAAARKGAATRKRRLAARRVGHGMMGTGFAKRTAKKAYARRARRRKAAARAAAHGPAARYIPGIKMNPSRKRRRRKARRANAPRRKNRRLHARRVTRRRRRRNPAYSTQRSMLRARRTIRNRYKTALGTATKRRYRMRSNPSGGSLKAMVMQALPVGLAFYGARALSNKFASQIPGINMVPAQFRGLAVAGLLGVIGHFATSKVAKLRKYRGGAMLGFVLNVADAALSAFAPPTVKAYLGLGSNFEQALGDYVQMGDYIQLGAQPINDDITLSDYIATDGYQQDLGVEEDLGVTQELGGDGLSRSWLGGVSRDAMLAPVPSRPMLGPVPDRSFTSEIPTAGASYDNADRVYAGIFDGGF